MTTAPADWCIGLMSGTSLDGVDGVLVDFSKEKPRVAGVSSVEFATNLRAELLALNQPGNNELHRAALASNGLARAYAQVVQTLLAHSQLQAAQIAAIGAHGQTVRHQPGLKDAAGQQVGYTLQLNQPALLAELTGIDVVADFRSRDVAAGGQGAPLAPFFHEAWFAQRGRTLGVLNIGGISNLTILDGHRQSAQAAQRSQANQTNQSSQPAESAAKVTPTVLGFDTGVGNALLDMWCQQHTAAPFDAGGAWGAGGTVNRALLQRMLAEPYFCAPPPKSTGRDLFNRAWLDGHLAGFTDDNPQNVQATLVELTVRPVIDCIVSYQKRSKVPLDELIVCGGGAHNHALMQRLQALLPGTPVVSSAQHGLPPQQVEGAAFAWLARKTLRREALPLPSVTGARGARVLGCIYPR